MIFALVRLTHTYWALLLLGLFVTCSAALHSVGTVTTKDGSVIHGNILSVEGGVIKIETSYAGVIEVKQDEVTSFSSENTINLSTQEGDTYVGIVEGDGDILRIAADGGTFETDVSNVSALWQPGEDSPEQRALKEQLAASERKWKFDANVDISGKSGNSDRTATGIGASAVLESSADRLGFYVGIDKAEENSNTTADEIKAGVDYSSFFSETFSWYVRSELEKDDIELLDLRSTTAFGIGKHLIRRDDQKLEFRGGLAYRFESFQDGSEVEGPGLDLAVIHFKDLGWGSLNNVLTLNPAFEDFANYRVYHESSLDFPVGTGDFWKLRIGVSNDYNSKPIAGLMAMDTTYFTRLLLSWR